MEVSDLLHAPAVLFPG